MDKSKRILIVDSDASCINGYEVACRIRQDSATRDLPILMVADQQPGGNGTCFGGRLSNLNSLPNAL
jgi:CheY-like chemotaxis protein